MESLSSTLRIFGLAGALVLSGIAEGSVISYTSSAAFQADATGALTALGFDVDSGNNPIAADSPGIRAGSLFAGYGITFASGVVFGEPLLPFSGVSPPNIISNSGINTPTPALVDGSFSSPVYEVGITNVGAVAELRIFDVSNILIGSIMSDSDNTSHDFVGLISTAAIYRMEYDFISGIGFGADDLLFSQIPEQVPEPTTLALLGLGLAGISFMRRKAA